MPENEYGQIDGQTESIEKTALEEPPRFRVLLHNDDYTTQDFVVNILMSIFNKSHEDAWDLMMIVHTKGIGNCGTYTQEIAETKVDRVRHEARQAGFPLLCTMEKV